MAQGFKRAKTIEDFLVVGIGASAGGLEAIEKFFSAMPSDPGMAFIIVSHLDPKRQTFLPDLIAKMTSMPVKTATNALKVKANEVYIIPPDKDMDIIDGKLQLVQQTELKGVQSPINHFMRSLAFDMRERSVGIVLSGMGADGTAGLREIKSQLGLVVAQDPNTAKYASMPESAIQTGITDMTLAPEKMIEALIEYSKRHVLHQPALQTEDLEGKTQNDLQKILARLRSITGHDFSGYKRNRLVRRIERRIVALHFDKLSQYVKYIYETPRESDLLFKEVLIGVTSFFRDPEAFDLIKEQIFPNLFKDRSAENPIRIWVAGCSTGEEAYSLAIMLREYMDQIKREFTVQIFASDIDPSAVEVARGGLYPSAIAPDVGEERLKKFFTKESGSYRIRADLREMLIFAVQDVIKDPPFTKLDLITCRNLLIYLTTELQKKLLPLFHYSLRPRGILFLGSSETIGSQPHLFTTVDKKWKIFQRVESGIVSRPAEFPFSRAAGAPEKPEQRRHAEPTLPQTLERILLAEFAPPSAVVNDKGDIIYIHGRTGAYLEPAPGRANLNILDMAREGLRLQLPAALRQAAAQKVEVRIDRIQVKSNGGYQPVNLVLRPIHDAPQMDGLLMVLFEEPRSGQTGPARKEKKKQPKEYGDVRVKDLERELLQSKENLQSTIEELESTNEELKSSNEEYQSTNEELQSANEELDTSKEELQSLNEELVTVNSELQSKFEELTRTNSDMRNFLDSLEVPTIFLDSQLRIKRFTTLVPQLIHLIESDIGRPISHIQTNLNYDKLVADSDRVLKTTKYVETEVEAKDGRWFLMRILPYKAPGNVLDGVVITFLDISELRRVAERLVLAKQLLSLAQSIVDTVREPLLVLDDGLRIVAASRSFYQTFQESEAVTIGKFIYDLGNKQWDIPRLRELLERILPFKESFDNFSVDLDLPNLGKRNLQLNARRLRQQSVERILLAFEDVTEQQEPTH